MRATVLLAAILFAASVADARPHRTRVAQSEDAQEGDATNDRDQEEESDGPEALAALPIKIDDLIEVAVRLAPDLARARIDR
ncbi:MAG TPA: hypothetical protein VLB44_12845, partial [Kofleriaceae bacterium]|nr:hypothetical protein [Kofleriaceae bacterium]